LPGAARAQQSAKLPVVGYLSSGSRQADAFRLVPFLEGLRETGFVEGKNVAIEYRWAEGQFERLPVLASDLVNHQAAVIATVSGGVAPALAAQTTTRAIPIVFAIGGDPKKLGLVASLNRPDGNITGVTNLNAALGPKRIQLLCEVTPNAAEMGILVNPNNPDKSDVIHDARLAIDALGRQTNVLMASTDAEIDAIFSTLAEKRITTLYITADADFNARSRQLGTLSARYATPAVFSTREFALSGGLMSYGTVFTDLQHTAGVYVGRILKGEKPSDLPVVQPTKFEFVINLKAAKTLGLTIPQTLLAIADEVIE
jgi:putative tryptophan/tyrosine transport system substrate-binding protein